jgi:ubiquitin C
MDEPNMFDVDDETETGEFTICIKTVQGDTDNFQVRKDMKIDELRKKYCEDKGFNRSGTHVKFNFKGKNLEENKTFGDYDISSDDTLHVLVRLSGGY